MKGCDSGTSGGRRICNTRGPPEVTEFQILGDLRILGVIQMKCVSNDYTDKNTNPKTLTTLTLTLTDPHDLIQKFFYAIPCRRSLMPANTLCTEKCLITRLIVILPYTTLT